MENRADTNLIGLLTIAFVVLKLTKTIDWSWWWVVSPIWIMFLFYIFIAIVISLIHIIKEKLYWRKRKKDAKKYRYTNFKKEIKLVGEEKLRMIWMNLSTTVQDKDMKEFEEFLNMYKKENNEKN